ncbi:MAG: 16S rRNA methyltransferase [Candidatus Thorarchaeota archaeon]
MLHIILLECPLELVPKQISALKEVQQHAARRRKHPCSTLLDQAYHGRAIMRLPNHERRGRPDIVHMCLMTLLESPLCKSRLLRVHLHLMDGTIVELEPDVRLPRNYERFCGLIEQLLERGRVPPTGDPLLRVTGISLHDLIEPYLHDSEAIVMLASESGTPTSSAELAELLPPDSSKPVLVGVGAFPHGDFSNEVSSLFKIHRRFDPEVMMAWHVCAQVLWTYSLRIDITRHRFGELNGS